jgi:hypothetical protein
MSYAPKISEKTIKIRTLEHLSGGLFMAVSDDVPGLSVAGLSQEEIEKKIPGAIREFLELLGHKVLSVEIIPDALHARAHFGLPGYIAHASLMAA